MLLKALRDLQDTDRIPRAPITVDSPMALAAMRVYRRAIDDGDPELLTSAVAEGADIITPQDCFESTTPDESKRLDLGGPRIILSASGMGTGGRVVHHLKALLPDRDNTVILAGYQAVGTPGRALLDGAKEMKFHGEYVKVRAEIVDVGAFSVHADADELMAWLKAADRTPREVFIIHGEPDAAAALAKRVHEDLDLIAVVPALGERVSV